METQCIFLSTGQNISKIKKLLKTLVVDSYIFEFVCLACILLFIFISSGISMQKSIPTEQSDNDNGNMLKDDWVLILC